VNLQHPLARTLVTTRTWPFLIDTAVAACGLAIFFSIVSTGNYWMGKPIPIVPISHSISALPAYAFYSIVRIAIAYLLSLVFAISYGYIAAYNPRVEAWMVAVLDILQSIPVLSFLPPVVLAMVALVPGHQMGIEMGVILLIFTGQVWNLAFSFYSSLKSIPREMIEAASIYRYSAWQRFWQLEMPYAAIGLVWNSIVSVAGGWFALIACEMFTMGDRNFQLPGLGSYLQTATASGDIRALVAGFLVVILIVVATDQLLWRPLIAWSDRSSRPIASLHLSLNSCAGPISSLFPAASGIGLRSPSTVAWRAPVNAALSIPWTKTGPIAKAPPDSGPWLRRQSALWVGEPSRPSSC
jgi:NitT/TauT family transport system permease protein